MGQFIIYVRQFILNMGQFIIYVRQFILNVGQFIIYVRQFILNVGQFIFHARQFIFYVSYINLVGILSWMRNIWSVMRGYFISSMAYCIKYKVL